jgi:hypothetical protein
VSPFCGPNPVKTWTEVMRWEEHHHPGPRFERQGHANPPSPTSQHNLDGELESIRRTELLLARAEAGNWLWDAESGRSSGPEATPLPTPPLQSRLQASGQIAAAMSTEATAPPPRSTTPTTCAASTFAACCASGSPGSGPPCWPPLPPASPSPPEPPPWRRPPPWWRCCSPSSSSSSSPTPPLSAPSSRPTPGSED